MKRYIPIVIGLTIITIMLGGCEVPGLGQATPTPLPLSQTWPTPVQVAAKVSPTSFPAPPALPVTPFPREAGATPTATPTRQAEAKPEVEVKAQSINVRQGPGVAYEPLGVLNKGDKRPLSGRNSSGDWLQIDYSTGKKGWVSAALVTAGGSLGALPQVAAPALPSAVSQAAAVKAAASTASTLPGKLTFAPSPGGNIYVVNADGTNLRQVASGLDPVLSPDGKKIAYASWTDPRGIWVANADGSDKRHYFLSDSARGPAWSPDGKRIAFWHYTEGSTTAQLKVWKSEKGSVPDMPGDAWFWDESKMGADKFDCGGKLCWYEPPDPHYQLGMINLEDGSFEDLPSDLYSHNLTWMPDGKTIAYKAERGLATLTLEGKAGWLSTKLQDDSPVWSPDGQSVVIQWWGHDHWEIVKLSADGASRATLTQSPPFEDKPWNNVSPAWSPDSKQIAFVTDRRGRWEVWVMNADGSDPRPMFNEGLPGGIAVNYGGVRERVISWSK